MSESSRPPYHGCKRCGNDHYTKQVSKPAPPLIVGGRSERSPWPLRVPKLEKFNLRAPDGSLVRDAQGRPVVGHKDVVFKSAAEQREYLDRQGLALMMDGEADSTFNPDSQKSAYHQGDGVAPTPEADRLQQQTFFVEDPNEISPGLLQATA